MDIRFVKLLTEYNRHDTRVKQISIVHLYMLGFHEELSNFKLSLNNPSTQGEMLKVEQWRKSIIIQRFSWYRWYKPTSHTWKKNIFNWSEDEIKLDLEQQRLEKAEENWEST